MRRGLHARLWETAAGHSLHTPHNRWPAQQLAELARLNPARQPAHAWSLVPALHCLWCERCTAAPEPQFHAVWEASKRLVSAGFTQLSERQPWSLKPGGRYFFTRNARWGSRPVDRLCGWVGGWGMQSVGTALFAVGCCSPHRAVSLRVGRWGWKAAAGAEAAVLREGPLAGLPGAAAGRPGSTPLRSAAPCCVLRSSVVAFAIGEKYQPGAGFYMVRSRGGSHTFIF